MRVKNYLISDHTPPKWYKPNYTLAFWVDIRDMPHFYEYTGNDVYGWLRRNLCELPYSVGYCQFREIRSIMGY